MNINEATQARLDNINASIDRGQQDNFNAGYVVGQHGQPCSCPHDMEDIGPHDDWVHGWERGRKNPL